MAERTKPDGTPLFSSMEIFETADLCDVVYAEVAQLPCERFHAFELATLVAIFVGKYAKDQAMLDWLFDLRRVTKQTTEGSMYYDARLQPNGWSNLKHFHRPILLPQPPLTRIYA